MAHKIEVIHDPRTGYLLFKIKGEHVLGYQRLGESHHFIPRESPACTIGNAEGAAKYITERLRAEGGDVAELMYRVNPEWSMPL
jgi:hypothetical protein